MTASEPVLTKIASDLNLRPCRHQVQAQSIMQSPAFAARVRALVLEAACVHVPAGCKPPLVLSHTAFAPSAALKLQLLALPHYLSTQLNCTDCFS